MRNNSNTNKDFTLSEIELHSRIYNDLTSIKNKSARHAIAGEIVRDMREFDIGV